MALPYVYKHPFAYFNYYANKAVGLANLNAKRFLFIDRHHLFCISSHRTASWRSFCIYRTECYAQRCKYYISVHLSLFTIIPLCYRIKEFIYVLIIITLDSVRQTFKIISN